MLSIELLTDGNGRVSVVVGAETGLQLGLWHLSSEKGLKQSQIVEGFRDL